MNPTYEYAKATNSSGAPVKREALESFLKKIKEKLGGKVKVRFIGELQQFLIYFGDRKSQGPLVGLIPDYDIKRCSANDLRPEWKVWCKDPSPRKRLLKKSRSSMQILHG